ncbi:MAG: phage tail protein [Yokenella regensburgei]|jgi:hypothetical protein|uniref:Tail completion protein R (GpR) n=1 Tax=Yokenella regensburgei TaxID=158877 RepID=A0AB38FX04_9ENTR|nr:phage tail protein [Yokenella regensburgei]KFD23546.1 phage tail protein [Yokenella regensburgei ATCC 49455]MDR3106445.1 phage tail protein [Yokenella regensburgei]RKR54196.1 tail completion protein R (GpR) [Yokenella regensburgei]SQA62697.1 P2 phage tail completion protein R (GpR) [Yokenella regensburgei]SQA96219.1 P2 phage tail completion protein R (GpR) [Yokenella regensburgei]
MQKPKNLRDALINAVPQLSTHPEMLQLSVESGRTDSRLASSLSFEKIYTLNIHITNFTGDLDAIFVPVLVWLREHQPDLMTTDEGQKNGFTWLVAVNTDDSLNITLTLKLTERTLVKEVNGELHASYSPEPALPEPVTRPVELYINGELISKWVE